MHFTNLTNLSPRCLDLRQKPYAILRVKIDAGPVLLRR